MKIKHNPVTDIDYIKRYYIDEYNIPLDYVCTTELNAHGKRTDVFIKSVGKSYFGREYVGFYIDSGRVNIVNARNVENLEFHLYKNIQDEYWYYSRDINDQFLLNNTIVKGGRFYPEIIGDYLVTIICLIKDGMMLEKTNEMV